MLCQRQTASYMKRFCCLLFLLLPAGVAIADVSGLTIRGSADLLLQYNGTAKSKLTPISGIMSAGFNWASGRYWSLYGSIRAGRGRNGLHGTPGAWVPVNEIAWNTYDSGETNVAVLAGENFVCWENCSARLRIGLLDLTAARSGSAFTAPSGNDFFINPHFRRMLAVHAFEREQMDLIPAVEFRWQITPQLHFSAAFTAGDSDYHVFIRNTLPVELSFSWQIAGSVQQLVLQGGFADADASGTHRISSSGGILFRHTFRNGWALYGGYSSGTAADEVNRIFTDYRQHITAGFTGSAGIVRWGVACSSLKHYDGSVPELAYGVYAVVPLQPFFSLSFDCTLLRNAAGVQTPVWLPAIRFTVYFPGDKAR